MSKTNEAPREEIENAQQPENMAPGPIVVEYCGAEVDCEHADRVVIYLKVDGNDDMLDAPAADFAALFPKSHAPDAPNDSVVADLKLQFKGILNFLNDPTNSAEQKREMLLREIAKL